MVAPVKNYSPAPEWPEQGQWTYDDWARLPEDGTRYEVIDGVLYLTPPPAIPHQFSSNRLSTAMTNHADAKKLGNILTAPVGVRLPDQPVPLQPDIAFVSTARKSIIGKQYVEGAPDLVVEILSPSNWPFDRQEKFRVYQAAGVPEYWIVDYRAKTVEVFALEEGEYVLLGKYGMGDAAASRVLAN
ncbi:MAG: Uma2 family endonuclease, partial [Chloroflexi bacterium]|nr:Uma2 family endonuclease [Chloroflexota bacterium]